MEVPWIVPVHINQITFTGTGQYETRDGELVGSAEQAFLYLKPSPGKYVAISPCFREENETYWNQSQFMKVELFDNIDFDYLKMLNDAKCLMSKYGTITEKSNDLLLNGIEVGSYGKRDVPFKWAFGTGLAEPRFSQALNHIIS